MASDISVKLAVDGEREFKQALKSINSELKETDSALKLAEQGMGSYTDAEGNVITQSELLEQKLQQQSEKYEMLSQRYQESAEKQEELRQKWEEAVAANGENSEEAQKAAMAYEKQAEQTAKLGTQMNKAKYEMNETSSATKKSTDIMSELSNVIQSKTGVNVKGLASKFEELTSVSSAYAMGAAAVVAVLAKIAEETAKALKETASYVDELDTLSAKSGVSIQELQELYYVEDLVDVKVTTLTSSMRKNIKAMEEASSGSATYAQAYSDLGISVEDGNGHLRNSSDVFWEVIDALRNMDNETERDAVAMQVLGKSAQELNPLIKMSKSEFEALRQEAHTAGYVLGDEDVESFQKLQDEIDRTALAQKALSEQWSRMFAEDAAALQHYEVLALRALTNVVKSIGDLKTKLDGLKDTKIGKVFDALQQGSLRSIPVLGQLVNVVGFAKKALDKYDEKTSSSAESSEKLAESEENLADAMDNVTTAAETESDALSGAELSHQLLTNAQEQQIKKSRQTQKTLNDIATACDEASGSGEELKAEYDRLKQQYDEMDGAGSAWQRNLVEQKLAALEAKAAHQMFLDTMDDMVTTLNDELPAASSNMCVSLESVAATLYGTQTSASEWAGWYNAAFDEVTNGFDTLVVNTDNTMDAWITAMEKNAEIEATWTSNRRYILDNIDQMGAEDAAALRTAVDIMSEGGVEEYGMCASELQAAMQQYMETGDEAALAEIQRLTGAINQAADVALHEAAARFMEQEQLNEQQLAEYVANGKVILEDGKCQWSEAASDMAGSVPDAINDSSADADSATRSVVSTASNAFVGGEAQMAWENGGKALGVYMINGINAKQADATTAATTVATTAGTEAGNAKSTWESTGKKLDGGLIAGIMAFKSNVAGAAQTVANDAGTQTQSTAYNSGWNVGSYFDQGFAQGIRDNHSIVYNAAYAVGQEAYSAAMAGTDAHSPSRLAAYVGQMFDLGFAKGINDYQSTVKRASESMAAAAVTAAAGVTNNYSNQIAVNVYGGSSNANQIANTVISKLNAMLIRQRGVVR